MNILFYLPRSMLDVCFDLAEMEALRGAHALTLPEGDDEAGLLKLYRSHAAAADVVITGWSTPDMTPAMLDQAPRLRLILHSAGSIRHLIPRSALERGIRIGTANDALAVGVAEMTLGMIIAGLKGVFPLAAWTRQGKWRGAPWPVRELDGITIGLISASKVGRHVIRLLRNFNVRVQVYDPYLSDGRARELGVEKAELLDLCAASDAVSLHAPSLPQTRHMLKAEHFAAMRDGTVFINTARGAIVDEQAMIQELRRNRIFAFIDVTDPEPPAADSPLRTLPNVALTPHIAGNLANGRKRQGRYVLAQLREFAAGQPIRGEVTAAMWDTMA